MRRTLAVVVAAMMLALAVGGAHGGSDLRTSLVVCTATRSHLVAGYPNRQDLILSNAGTLHVNVGRGSVMRTLHAAASLTLENYQGGADCQTQPGTGSTAVEILEVVR